jgi:hypothetical protein
MQIVRSSLFVSSLAVVIMATMFAGCGDDSSAPPPTVTFSGIAWQFSLPGQPYGRIAGAHVYILEDESLTTTTTGQGEFTIENVPVDSQATLVLVHENHPLTFSKTHTVPDTDITDLTFQIPTNELFSQIEAVLGIDTDPEKCHIVSTFTRYGRTIGDQGHHGEPGALLSVAPENTAEEGPIYFNDFVLPDRERDYSSLDGGVLLVNVSPGDYTLSAACIEEGPLMDAFFEEYPPEDYPDESLRCQTEDVQFESIFMKCRAGVFLNASPSYGLQAYQ